MIKTSYKMAKNLYYLICEIWKRDKFLFVYFIGFTLFSAVQPLIAILFPKMILSELIGFRRADILIKLLLVYFFTGSFVNFMVDYIRGVYFPRVNIIRLSFLGEVYKICMITNYMNTETPQFLDRLETVTRSLKRSDMGIEGIIHQLFGLGGLLITLIIYIYMISRLNIIILILAVMSVIIVYQLSLKQKEYEHKEKENVSKYNRRGNYIKSIMFDFTYGKEIRLFNVSNLIFDKFLFIKNKKTDIQKEMGYFKLKINRSIFIVQVLREIAVYIYLVYIYINGRITIAELIMYLSVIASLTNILISLIEKISDIYSCHLDINDFRSFIAMYDDVESEKGFDIPSKIESIEFKDVSFKYPGTDHYVLNDLNMRFTHGETISIIGHNGAGKSTFIKLLCGLYDVTEGEILLNGVNIKNFNKKDYYALFSAVFQEVIPLAFSVAENITLKEKEDIDYGKIEAILDDLGILEVVERQKFGINTAMQKFIDNAGTQFSGGQNQKILMARAINKSSDIIILDEPTSALDPLAEREIYTQFSKIVSGKLAFYISHRMASTQFCDKIMVFDRGRLAENGTHLELMEEKGIYYDMFSIQSQYYNSAEVSS